MSQQTEKVKPSENGAGPRRPLRQYLLSGVAAAALIAAAPAIYHANADAPVLQKNEAPDTLTLNQKAAGLPDFTQLVQRVKPAVVSVRVKEQTPAQVMSEDNSVNPFKGTPFERFFRDFQGRRGGQWQQIQPTTDRGARVWFLHFRGRLYRDQQPCGRQRHRGARWGLTMGRR